MQEITVASTRDFSLSSYEMILGVAVIAFVAWMIVTGVRHLRSSAS